MATITLDGVSLKTAAGVTILDDVSFHVAEGELVVVVGPSGSGKTSIIRSIAGLESISSGAVFFDEEDFTRVKTAERDVGIVFQEHALFPTRTARGNVGFPLKVRSMSSDVIRKRVDAEARALGIEHIMERWPKQLSAGHQQLVQMARAMVRVPNVLLLDEPMAHLDLPTRKRLRRDFKELQQGYGVTTVYATNDPADAMFMADRIIAIEDGRLRQIGRPDELYANPADTHIAWLTGPISFFDARVERDADGFWIVGDGFRIRAWPPQLDRQVNRRVTVGVRPEGLRLVADSPVRAVVDSPSFESGTPVTRVRFGGGVVAMGQLTANRGDEVGISLDSFLIFDDSERLVAAVE